jgi:hypothetical protein
MPLNRLDHLQRDLKTPVPSSTQWDVVKERVELVRPVYDELVRLAAQGSVVHNDDSYMRILQFMGKRRAFLLKKGQLPDPERTGLFTTAIVSIAPERPAIALFFTGRKHAGENLADVLRKRAAELSPPIQMGDALTRNVPDGHKVIESNGLAHGRRKIVDEIENDPAACRYLLERLGLVYEVDETCRQEKLSDQERLSRHQRQSAPVMAEIRQWMQEQFDKKRIEPNSGLGQAFNYLLKRWDKFTLFLQKPGAPLDNNVCERALKMAIQHRNNSLFYRSTRGAQVGDVYMTLLHTAQLHGENPFDYLTALQRHEKAVAEKPGEWLPWTYKDTLARMGVNEVLPSSSHPQAPSPNAPTPCSRRKARRDRSPLGRGLRRVRVTACQQHVKLVREQLAPWLSLRAGPVTESPLRQAFLAKPVTLAVVRQDLDRRRAAIAEHEHGSRKWIRRQRLPAQPAEPIDPLPEIHGLDRDQDTHLRGQLDHDSRLQNAWARLTMSTVLGPVTSIRIRPPPRPTSSTTVLPPKPSGPIASSTKGPASVLSLCSSLGSGGMRAWRL